MHVTFPLNVHSQRGFTLIELSIVLVIIALVAGALLSFGVNQTQASKVTYTQERLAKIEDAIMAFLYRNQRLPCPALGSTAIGAAGYGDEDCSNTLIDLSAVPAPDILVGTVPVSALLLPDEWMFDSWGRRITYVVEAGFTTKAGFLETGLAASDEKNGSITVFVREDDAASPPTHSTEAVMVLISHGENGHGAWLKNGGADARLDAGSTDTAELENAHDPADDASFDNEFTQAPRSAGFDDMVRYLERWQAVLAAGGMVDDEICSIIYATNQPYDRTATPKQGPVGCEDDTDPGTFASADPVCLERQSALARALIDLCFVANPAP